MGIAADINDYDWHAALAALDWQVQLGVTEVIGDSAIDRYDLPQAATPVAKPAATPAVVPPEQQADPVSLAKTTAAQCADLAALQEAVKTFDHCTLKKGARNLVFGEGAPAAQLMIIGDAPGRTEDIEGQPFLGPAGQMLARMLAAIGFERGATDPARAVYISSALPWKPVNEPDEADIAMMRPFLARQIELVAPRIVIVMGNSACSAVLGKQGISRLRGTWQEANGIAVMPMVHPSQLQSNPSAKRTAWQDLLAVKARLRANT